MKHGSYLARTCSWLAAILSATVFASPATAADTFHYGQPFQSESSPIVVSPSHDRTVPARQSARPLAASEYLAGFALAYGLRPRPVTASPHKIAAPAPRTQAPVQVIPAPVRQAVVDARTDVVVRIEADRTVAPGKPHLFEIHVENKSDVAMREPIEVAFEISERLRAKFTDHPHRQENDGARLVFPVSPLAPRSSIAIRCYAVAVPSNQARMAVVNRVEVLSGGQLLTRSAHVSAIHNSQTLANAR
ncbi:hypothetical protein [Lignipirellula cremea]|uniref:DUF11 domain-containing protein n=1 Tax=Lignipirellula cremea TaxID=2528010 RepID=A0A518DYV1_9BACT|nr:hypothetical protein [Lignipirellula cremea]QDU96975.1 hypothetical protein Pla8534_48000 [Lignipirellula cremea]